MLRGKAGTSALPSPIQYLGSASKGLMQAFATHCTIVQLSFTGMPLGVQQLLILRRRPCR